MFITLNSKDRQRADLVKAVYRGVLQREPDDAGFKHWIEFLREGGTTANMLRDFVDSEEFRGMAKGAPDQMPLGNVLRSIYQALLERDPDKEGFAHWMGHLRNGRPLTEILETIATSDEYLHLVEARGTFRTEEINAELPVPDKRITILGNCQGETLGRCMQAMTGVQPAKFYMISLDFIRDGNDHLEQIEEWCAASDLVLIQPVFARELKSIRPHLLKKAVTWPSISFAAYQPDQCYVRIKGFLSEVKGPLGPYHSSIAYFAWRRGLKPAQAVRLFRTETYEQLRFFDYWDSATQALLNEGQRSGIPLDGLFQKWRSRGCFMHSINHPKVYVLEDLARVVLQKLGIAALPHNPAGLIYDNMADQSVWPVYPEIAAQLGVEGSYIFKGNNPGLPSKSPLLLYNLEEFVERSFKAYDEFSAKYEIICDRPYSQRYRDVFENSKSLAPPPSRRSEAAETKRLPSTNPYAGLPAERSWRKAVEGVAMPEVDPVGPVPFSISPETKVATAGSCFAQHISNRLRKQGFNYLVTESGQDLAPGVAQRRNFGVYSARYGNLYTARQLLQLFDRAYGAFVPAEPVWTRPDGACVDPFRPAIEPDGFPNAAAVEAARAEHLGAVRQMFETLDVFVFTLGLTEAWRSRQDGAVFPLAPGVAGGTLDPLKHEFVNFGVSEVVADLDAFLQRLHQVNPAARVIFTVSPVPLAATYEDRHVLVSTTCSKSILRAAADEVVRRHPGCSYFPSYEIITGNFNRGAYYESDLRSVTPAGVDHVMRLFFRHYTASPAAVAVNPELLDEAERIFKIVCEEQLVAAD